MKRSKNQALDCDRTGKGNRMKVVGIDYPCIDYLLDINRLPDTNGETEIYDQSYQGGGMVATALAALGRLGETSAMIGVVGDDAYGSFCLRDLRRHKVDTSAVIVDKGTTTDFTICAAERETSGRSFLVRWGNHRKLKAEDLDVNLICAAEYLYLCGEMDAINVAAARIAKENGVKVAIDADHASESTIQNLQLIDVLIASEFFLDGIRQERELEDVCDSILKKGPSLVVFTLGARGCAGKSVGEDFFELPAYKVRVVDTTGAGDVFHGAFLYGLIQKWNPRKCGDFASAVAAIKCTYLGGRAGIPDRVTTERFLSDGEIDNTELEARAVFYRSGLEKMLKRENGDL